MVKYRKQLYLLITLALVLSSFSFNNPKAGAATLLSDDFTGTTIDTAKWNEIDPAGAGGTSGNIQQNGSLSIANSFSGNWAQNGLISQNSFSNTNLSISAVMTRGSDQLLGYGDYNFQSAGTKSYIIDLSSGGCLMLVWDNGSLANNTSCGSNISGATYELRLVSGGFEVYANGTLKGTLSTSTVINNKPIYLESSAAASTYDDVLVTGVSNNTAPDAPTSLTATAGDTQVGLSWTAPVNNGGSAITDYLVEYKLTSSGSWNTFNDGTSTSTSATVTGLTNNSSYDFRVSATNAIGTSSPSSTATATPSPPTVPAAPTIGTATAGNGQVSVSFTPGSNGGSAITSFTVTSSPGGFTGSGSSSPITVSGLSNGTAYTFTVTATNAVGTSSASSASNSVTPSTEVPTSIANLSLWLDGSDTNSITTSSGNITQINDKSGGNHNATASGGFTPALISNAQNGRSVMRFNGTSNYLTISNSVTYRTVVVVAKYNGTTFADYNGIVGDPTGSSPNNGHIVNGVAGTEKIASATSSYTSAYRDGTSISGSGGHDFSPLNEYWIGVFQLPASNTNTTSSIGFINGGSRYWNGDIAEVIAYSSTLTVDQRTSLEAYLSTKWNITVAGPSAPGAPTGLSADPGNTQVALTWSAPGSNGGSSITDYQVEYKLHSDSSWTTFNDGTSTSTSATVTGLTNNTSYDFRVSAINGVGAGTASSTATATPHAPTAPSAPTGVSANAGNAQATVSFSAPASGGSPITSYTVTSSPGGFTGTGSSSPITVTGLTNGQSYTFTVTATNAIGTSSPSSASNSVTPATIGNVLVDDFTGTTINTSKWNEIDPGGAGGTSGSIQQNGSLTIANSYVGGVWGANALVSQDSFVATNLEFSATMTAGSSPLLGYGDYLFGDSSNTAYLLYITASGSQILALVWQNGSYTSTSCGTADVGAATYKMKIISGGFEVYKNNSLLCTMNTGVVITNKPVFMENSTTASTFDDVLVYGTATVHSVPDAPTIGTATAGDGQASVTFSAPANNGGSTITSYTVTSSPGGLTASGSSSPITVTGLTNGQSYTFTVTATNSVGTSAASAASNSATPTAAPAPGQVTNLEALGVNQQVLLNWDAPGSGGSPTDYAIFYKLSSDSTWTAFIDGVSAVTKTTVTGLTNGAAYDFQVFAVNGGGSGTGSATATATPNAISTLAFVITGESNSGGIGLNSDATSQEMQPHSAVQIMNLTSGNFQFENLRIGVNNLRDHAGLESYYDNSHGFELQLANSTEANAFPDNPQVYLIKTGHGGSTVSQWDVNGTYWTKFLQRTNAGKTSVPAGRQWVVWMSLGINDSIAGTPTSTWKAAMVAHINKIKAQLPGAIVVMTEFQSMTAGSGYPAYNAIMDQIAAEEANVYVVDSTGAALRDGNHWSYSGLKTVTSRMVTVTENALGLVYPGTPTGLNVTPSGTQAALSWTAPVATGSSSISDYRIQYKQSSSNTWLTYSHSPSTTTSATVTGLSGGTSYDFRVAGVNTSGAGNFVLATSSTTDADAPVISATSASKTDTTASITWTTNENASTYISYGLTPSYGVTTSETDTSPRVTSHTVNLNSLVPCTLYHYQAKSKDAALNLGTDSDRTFTTTGCVGSATVTNQTAAAITNSSGGTVQLTNGGTGLSLSVPANAVGSDATFQIHQLDSTAALNAAGTPTGVISVAGLTFELKSLTSPTTSVTSFSHPITLTFSYNPADISGINETSLVIYHYSSGAWTPLTNCAVDTNAHTVSCETSSFSMFSLMGTAQTSSGGGPAPAPLNSGSNSNTSSTKSPIGSNIVTSDGTIFTVTKDGIRRAYTSAAAFLSYGFNTFVGVVPAKADDSSIAIGSFIPPRDGSIICSDRGTDKGTCYLITDGKKAGFTSATVFKALGFSFANSKTGDVSFMASDSNIDSSSQAHRKGTLVLNGQTLQLVGKDGLVGIPSMDVLISWGYDYTKAIPANSYDKQLSQTKVLSSRSAGELGWE